MTARQWTGASRDPFATGMEEDGGYKPWRMDVTGHVRGMRIVPAPSAHDYAYRISLLQVITIREHPQSSQICLLCHSSGDLVYIEGRYLDELAELIDDKRVKSIHVYDENHHGPLGNDEPVISSVRVESRINEDLES